MAGSFSYRAPVETEERMRMKEPYSEGVANHAGLESCGVDRKVGVEALTEVRTGQPSSCEIKLERDADAVVGCARLHSLDRYCKTQRDPARSETLCTYGILSCRNWEIPRPIMAATKAMVRTENPKGVMR